MGPYKFFIQSFDTSDANVKAAATKVVHQCVRFQAPKLILSCIRVTLLSGQSGWGLTWSNFNLGSLRLDSRIDSAIDTSSYLATICLNVIHRRAPTFSWLWDLLNLTAYWLFFQFSLDPNHSSQRIAMVSGPQETINYKASKILILMMVDHCVFSPNKMPQIRGHEHAFRLFCT